MSIIVPSNENSKVTRCTGCSAFYVKFRIPVSDEFKVGETDLLTTTLHEKQKCIIIFNKRQSL
jgi:hypothetical protein